MAIYVTSDLHGLSVENLEKLLEKAGFSDSDWLYILGDVIDRQNDGGLGVLQWLLMQPNAQLILGNHEAMLLSCDFVFDEITAESANSLSVEKLSLLHTYMHNGGDVTLAYLKMVNRENRDALMEILNYLREAPLYETVHAGGRDFILVHGGFENFRKDKKLSEYTPEELLWCRPKLDDSYFDNAVTVFGHTPTAYYFVPEKGKILFTPTWIDVDVGVCQGNPPALLRLDDLAEFYL